MRLESVNRPHDLKDHLVQILAEDAYQREVLDTESEEHLIGEDNEYADKEDWIDSWLMGMTNWFLANEATHKAIARVEGDQS